MNLIYLAGLTPKNIEVEIAGELTEKIDFEIECNLVGITSFYLSDVKDTRNSK